MVRWVERRMERRMVRRMERWVERRTDETEPTPAVPYKGISKGMVPSWYNGTAYEYK